MPFYFKKDGTWTWKKFESPTDIRYHRVLLISVYLTQEDPEQIIFKVCENRDIVVTTERSDRFFQGQEGLANREDIFITDLSTGKIMVIIHSEEPIKN